MSEIRVWLDGDRCLLIHPDGSIKHRTGDLLYVDATQGIVPANRGDVIEWVRRQGYVVTEGRCEPCDRRACCGLEGSCALCGSTLLDPT